jgi:very-short-patch-repair endonuclease
MAEQPYSPSPREGEGGSQPVRAGRVRGYSEQTLTRAKRLRRELTDAERKLWQLLRSRQLSGAKFRRQQPIGPFIVDFVCLHNRLIIEADGGQHSGSKGEQRRDAWLSSRGYRLLRFWNHDILGNPDGVLCVIAEALMTPHPAQPRIRSGTESPSPSRGEGMEN